MSHHHRFREQLAAVQSSSQPQFSRGFMACPLALTLAWQGQPCPWEALYRHAYEQALAVVRPSRLERLQPTSWN